jgi:hypothetical protein
MSDERKSLLWPWIVAVCIGVPLLYVASFGPACWITSRWNLPGRWLVVVYRPMTAVIELRSGILCDAVKSYSFLWASKDWGWWFETDGRVYTFEPGP